MEVLCCGFPAPSISPCAEQQNLPKCSRPQAQPLTWVMYHRLNAAIKSWFNSKCSINNSNKNAPLLLLWNLVHRSPMQQKPEESDGSHGMSWGPPGYSADVAQPKAAARPIPVSLKTCRYHHFSAHPALGSTNTCKAWLCWSNIKGRSNLLGRQHLTTWDFEDRRSKPIYQVSYQPVLSSLPPLPLA